MTPRLYLPLLLTLVSQPLPLREGWSQGLPELASINPMAGSRSGLYFQPYLDPAPGRWSASLSFDYASVVEYNRLPPADYVLDSELLRISLRLRRDLGSRSFLMLGASAGGAYAGFMDGFFDWYHGALGIRVDERERRPRDRFLYTVTLPEGTSVTRSRSNFFIEDIRLGLGLRHSSIHQTALSLTLPTSTGPEGFGRGAVSLSLLHTVRLGLAHDVFYEGSLGVGFTPTHGRLPDNQRELFLMATAGARARVLARHSIFANLFYHSPYYRSTTLPALDSRELSLDFGWILQTGSGGEWRIGLTEDLEPGGPGVDLVLRVGRTF